MQDCQKVSIHKKRIEFVLMARPGSCLRVAVDYNNTHDTVVKVIAKFKKTKSVTDKREMVADGSQLMKVQPTWCWLRLQGVSKNARSSASESEVSRASVVCVLKKRKWHPYKMQLLQSLSEDEPNRQTEIHEWVENKLLE
jgi:hypothetical protein